jgi:hypothetical protein
MDVSTMLNNRLVADPKRHTEARANDLFEKCRNFMRPAEYKAAGIYPYFEVFGSHEGCEPCEVWMGDRKILMFGSNDYLALTTDPRVKDAAAAAARKYGSGCSGSRLLNGTLDLHVEVEARLAALVRNDIRHRLSEQLCGVVGAHREGRLPAVRPQHSRQPGGGRLAVAGPHGPFPP